jgi:hypothetical protein
VKRFRFRSMILTLPALLMLSSQAVGQAWPDVAQGCPHAFSSLGYASTCLYGLLADEPIHLATNRYIAPGDGTIGAVAHTTVDFSDDSAVRRLTAEAAVSDALFWKLAMGFELRPYVIGEREPFNATVVYKRLAHLTFFGLGPDTPEIPYDFAADEASVTFTKDKIITSWLRLRGEVGYDQWRISASNDPSSVKANFTDATAPGITSQPRYLKYGLTARFHTEPVNDLLTVTEHFFEDISGQGASFFESDLVVQKNIYLDEDKGLKNGTLSLRLQINLLAAIHGAIPFYLQRSIGGADIDGQETLRGFQDYRFRGTNDAVVQIEYDHVLLKDYLHGFLLFDAGQVAPSGAELLRFDSLRHDVGAGLSLFLAGDSWLRAYVAFGGGEGVHANLHFTVPVF